MRITRLGIEFLFWISFISKRGRFCFQIAIFNCDIIHLWPKYCNSWHLIRPSGSAIQGASSGMEFMSIANILYPLFSTLTCTPLRKRRRAPAPLKEESVGKLFHDLETQLPPTTRHILFSTSHALQVAKLFLLLFRPPPHSFSWLPRILL